MKGDASNAKAQKTSRGCTIGDASDEQSRLGNTQGTSSGTGNDQIRFNDRDSSREDILNKIQLNAGNLDPGKMLECLTLLKAEHLAYVRAHRQRLETRLDENIESENKFLQACDLLEQQIHALIAKENSTEIH